MGDKQPVADEVTTPDAMTPDEMEGMIDEIGAGAADGTLDGEAEHSPEQLQLLLEDARNKADEHWNELLRAQAEHENMRKRAARDVEKARKFALEGFAKDLLPVRDSLEMGLSAAREVEGGHAQVLEGMELTLKLLTGVMEKYNICEIDPQGQPFDPELHQAMTTQPSDQYEPNTVLTVFQKGYLLNDRLIRPAMVVVSKA